MSDSGEPAPAGSAPAAAHPQTFRRHFLRAVPLLVAVTLLTAFLAHFGFLRPFETAALDSWLRLEPAHRSDHVVIVSIDECDYAAMFGSASPLDPAVVARILEAIAAGRPRMIGVDLDTSHPRFRSMPLPPGGVPVVWARGIVAGGGDCAARKEPPGTHPGALAPAAVLGGRTPGVRSGLAVLPRDPDGVVRRYQRVVETAGGLLPTLAWEIARGPRAEPAGEETEALVLNFAGDRYVFPRMSASDVLRVSGAEAWRSSGPLTGRIVLLGGFYRAARDEYATPAGPMAGVELVAQAVESELSGGGIRPANEIAMVLLELLGGTVLVWLHYRFRLGAALALSVLAMPLLSIGFSWIAFSSAALWANFVPILASVLIHQLYEHARIYRALYVDAVAARS